MKKALLPLAIIAALPLTALADGPIDGKVYGKVLVTVDNIENDKGDIDQSEVNSRASRLGFAGQTKLNDDLSVIYTAEYEISVDGDSQEFKQRNIYGGLMGSWGTLVAGKMDTPTKVAQNKIDQFNDLPGDFASTFDGENRLGNMIAYTTPNMSGFAATIAMIAAEGNIVDGGTTANDGFDSISAAVSYTAGDLYLAVSTDQDVASKLHKNNYVDLTRFVVQYTIADLQLGAMYEQSEDNATGNVIDEDGFFVSAGYKIDAVTLKAQFGSTENDADNTEQETWSVGADYKLGGNTKLLSYYTVNTDTNSASVDSEEKVLGVGLEHKF